MASTRLPRLVRDWPPALREDWEEYAARWQFGDDDNRRTRAEAEALAEAQVRAEREDRQLELGGTGGGR